MKKILCLIGCVGLVACFGEQVLDAENSDKFLFSFDTIVEGLDEQDRHDFAGDILVIAEDSKRNGEATKAQLTTARQEASRLLDTGGIGVLSSLRVKGAQRIVMAAGSVLHGKTKAEVDTLAEEIVARANEDHARMQSRQRQERLENLKHQVTVTKKLLDDIDRQIEAAESALNSEQDRQAVVQKFLNKITFDKPAFTDLASNGRMQDAISVKAVLKNGTNRRIEAIKGVVHLSHLHSDWHFPMNFYLSRLDMEPGAERDIRLLERSNWKPFGVTLAEKGLTDNPNDYGLSYEFEKVVLADGSKVSLWKGYDKPEYVLDSLKADLEALKQNRSVLQEQVEQMRAELESEKEA